MVIPGQLDSLKNMIVRRKNDRCTTTYVIFLHTVLTITFFIELLICLVVQLLETAARMMIFRIIVMKRFRVLVRSHVVALQRYKENMSKMYTANKSLIPSIMIVQTYKPKQRHMKTKSIQFSSIYCKKNLGKHQKLT